MRSAAALLAALASSTVAKNSTKRYEYNIVMVGDIHDDLAAVERLRRRLRKQSRAYQMLLCTGDLTSMRHSDAAGAAKPSSVTETNAYVRRAGKVAAALNDLAPLVYFVPGALDPLGLYDADPKRKFPPGYPRNAHGVVEAVTEGLWVAGWGGSTAPFEFTKSGTRRRANETAEHGWDGAWSQYPYDEREAARRQLPWRKRLLNLPAADAAILLTHAGPDGSGTTVVTGRDADSIERPGEVRARPLHAGSPALGELLAQKKAQARVVLHVHGRAHAAAGVARVGAALVVNPGSLRYTNTYASATLAELRTFEEDGTVLHSEWRVSRVAIADVADASADAPDDTEGLISPPKLFLLVLAFSIVVVVGAGLYARARHEGRQPRVCASRPLGEPRSPPPSPMAIRTKSRSSTDSESGL